MALGIRPVKEAIRGGARTIDALVADPRVRDGLDHESQRFCYRSWLAGEGWLKRETDDTRRRMAAPSAAGTSARRPVGARRPKYKAGFARRAVPR